MTKKKKTYDPFQHTMETGMLSVGTIGVTGIAAKTSQILPSPVSGKVLSGMETMSIIPTMHATGGVFMGLQDLESKVKNKRR